MPKLAVWQAAKHSAVKCLLLVRLLSAPFQSFRKHYARPALPFQYLHLLPSATSASIKSVSADHVNSCRQRGYSLFKGKVNHVKLLGQLFDRCQMVLVQLVDFLSRSTAHSTVTGTGKKCPYFELLPDLCKMSVPYTVSMIFYFTHDIYLPTSFRRCTLNHRLRSTRLDH